MAALRTNIAANLAAIDGLGVPSGASAQPCATPVLVDWLAHLEDRLPGSETPRRQAIRSGLILGLADPAVRGQQSAVDVLIGQITHSPALGHGVAESAASTLAKVATPKHFPQIASLLAGPLDDAARFWLIRYLRKCKTVEARDIAVSYLGTPFTVAALVALTGMGARGVRPLVAPLLDHPQREVRLQAKRALTRLPLDELA
ncbi:hypothetical protein A7R75_23390 [Mycolicibacterium llatzerense]|nr:hypothetical protein [Mycolicibacterium llatzerense]